MNKEIETLLKNARFDLTQEEKERFEKDYESFLASVKLLEEADLSKYEMLKRPLENTNDSDVLRSDDIIANNPWRVMEQASATEGDYIKLKEGK